MSIRVDSVKVEIRREKDRLKREAEEQAKKVGEERIMDDENELSLVSL